MAEYINRRELMQFPIRRENCDKDHANEHFINGIETVMEYVENLPAADVAPVVRCKDCKCYHEERGNFCDYHAAGVSPDWFCWNGERKDGDDK